MRIWGIDTLLEELLPFEPTDPEGEARVGRVTAGSVASSAAVSKATNRFTQAATDLGVAVDVRHFPEGTRTAADAAAAVGCDVGQIVKSLVFMVDDRPVIALTSGANRVDPSRLAIAAGGSGARSATADEARAATGYSIGGTPPFGHGAALATYVDPDLLRYETVWAAAGTPDTCFPIAPAELARAAGAVTADFRA